MNWQLFLTVFSTVFIAELGDKTQLATFLYASETTNPKWTVFFAAAAALILASAIGVLAGSLFSKFINPKYLTWIAGLGFIAIGCWTLLKPGP